MTDHGTTKQAASAPTTSDPTGDPAAIVTTDDPDAAKTVEDPDAAVVQGETPVTDGSTTPDLDSDVAIIAPGTEDAPAALLLDPAISN